MERVQVQLRTEQLAWIRRRAAAEDRSVAAVIRDAVDLLLGTDDRRRLIERAKSSIGGFHSGLGDVAERHDDYLADDIAERKASR